MRIFSLVMAAAILFAAPTGAAFAQSAPVVVVDSARVLAQSAAGQNMRAQLQTILAQVSQELEPEGKAVQAEEQAIAQALNGLDPQQAQAKLASDAALRGRAEAFEQRRQQFALRQAQQQELMRITENRAVAAFDRALTPVIQGVMNARGASVVLDRQNITMALPAVDITQDVLTRMDQEVKTIAVSRVTLEQAQKELQDLQARQQQGQQGQGGRANAPR